MNANAIQTFAADSTSFRGEYTERTSIRRTNDPRYVIRVVDLCFADGRVARSSYLIDVCSGDDADEMHVVSLDGGEHWLRN